MPLRRNRKTCWNYLFDVLQAMRFFQSIGQKRTLGIVCLRVPTLHQRYKKCSPYFALEQSQVWSAYRSKTLPSSLQIQWQWGTVKYCSPPEGSSSNLKNLPRICWWGAKTFSMMMPAPNIIAAENPENSMFKGSISVLGSNRKLKGNNLRIVTKSLWVKSIQ